MQLAKALFAATTVATLIGCTQTASTAIAAPCPEPAAAATETASPSPVQIENDRVCKSMYGLPCNALVHMIGPLTAELRKETRACVRETVSVYVSGQWVADNKYQDPKAGEGYGDHCIAVSL